MIDSLFELAELMQKMGELKPESSPEEIVTAFEEFRDYCEKADITDPELLLEINLLLAEGEEIINAFKHEC